MKGIVLGSVGVELERVWADRERWLPTLFMMMPPACGLRLLVVGADPDQSGTLARLLAEAGAGGSMVSVTEDEAVTEAARARYAGQAGYEFHTGPLSAGWPVGAPYDAVISLGWVDRVPLAWLRQCAARPYPEAMVLAPVRMGRAPWQRALLGLYLEDGLLRWPHLMFVANPRSVAEGCLTTYSPGPILQVHPAGDAYTVRPNHEQSPEHPAMLAQRGRGLASRSPRWVTTIDPQQPAHLVPIVYTTRVVPWMGWCGHLFNAGPDAIPDRHRLCSACVAAQRDNDRTGQAWRPYLPPRRP